MPPRGEEKLALLDGIVHTFWRPSSPQLTLEADPSASVAGSSDSDFLLQAWVRGLRHSGRSASTCGETER